MSLNGNTSQHSTPADNYYLYSYTEWHKTYDDLNAYWAGAYFEIDINKKKDSTILNAATLSLILYRKIRNLRLPLAIPLLFLFPIFGIALIISEIIHESTKQNEYESSKTNYKSMFFHSLLAATVIAFFLNPFGMISLIDSGRDVKIGSEDPLLLFLKLLTYLQAQCTNPH